MIKYLKNYNGTIDNISVANSVPSASNTDITNNSFDDYFQPASMPFDVTISAVSDSEFLALCVGFGSNVTATVNGIIYTVNKLGVVLIPVVAVNGTSITVTIDSDSDIKLNFLQFANEQLLHSDYQSGFLYSELVSARSNYSKESFGSPTALAQKRKAIPVTLNLPHVHRDNLPLLEDFRDTTGLKIADFDGVKMVIFDLQVTTKQHSTAPMLVDVSVKYKVWGN